MSEQPLETAQLDWREGAPASRRFDDTYFSRDDGMAESCYVFLAQNDLEHRFANPAQDRFTIGETGFGTGLNFLCAWQLRDRVNPELRLHYLSLEKFPLTKADLEQALGQWPQLKDYAAQLLAHYPPLTPGWHRLNFNRAGVCLDLYLGDAQDALTDAGASVVTARASVVINAWFLDGFAPAKNPDMWSSAIFNQIARLSDKTTSFATFTSASSVRDGLQAVGFEVERIAGFGRKRHMLKGNFNPTKSTSTASLVAEQKPWFARPSRHDANKEAVVLGGGLSGCAAAFSLAQRGWRVTVIERHGLPASEASGNQQGVLYHKLGVQASLASNFFTAGLLYSIDQIRQIFGQSETTDNPDAAWQQCGVLQLAADESERTRQQQLLVRNPHPGDLVYPVTQEQASALAGITIDKSGLFFPLAGWVSIPSLCEHMLAHPLIKLIAEQQVEAIIESDSKDAENEQHGGDAGFHSWKLAGAEGRIVAQAPVVIIANAADALKFAQCDFLPLKTIRGQTTSIPASGVPELKTVVCGHSYIAPPINGRYHMGATYDIGDSYPHCRKQDHLSNLRQTAALLANLFPADITAYANAEEISGKVGMRCTSPDYLPIVGPLPDKEAFLKNYALLRKDASLSCQAPGTFKPGLFVSLAHGSKGLISCLIAGEVIASSLAAESMPLAQRLVEAVHPARFLIRDLIRNRI